MNAPMHRLRKYVASNFCSQACNYDDIHVRLGNDSQLLQNPFLKFIRIITKGLQESLHKLDIKKQIKNQTPPSRKTLDNDSSETQTIHLL